MQSIDFSAAIADLDQQISRASDYLKKLRKHKRQLVTIQQEQAAIAQIVSATDSTAPDTSACYQDTPAIVNDNHPLEQEPAIAQIDQSFADTQVVPLEQEVTADSDPWTQPVEEVSVVPVVSTPVAAPTLYLLPPAKNIVPQPPMNRDQLRKACQAAGIRWRNAHGVNKHLTVSEMQAALSAQCQAA